MRIKRPAFEFIIEAGRNLHPKEFAGLLRGNKEEIKEVLFLPGTALGESSAHIDLNILPLDPSVIGSIHSHPSPNPNPSRTDLLFFSRFGFIHAIVAFPYTSQSLHFYDPHGKELKVVVE